MAEEEPLRLFGELYQQARKLLPRDPNGMVLSTVSADGRPSSRVVLLKDYDARGFVFYTNYQSRKGRELEANPRAAMCFYWQPLERQVRIEGTVEKTTRRESDEYFHSRPVNAQIGAWVSQQGEALSSREELDRRETDMLAKFGPAGPVPLPDYWGGYRLIPSLLEFWQGRPSRLHDRIEYARTDAGGWRMRRLSP